MKNHLNNCPKCQSTLKITRYDCPVCSTRMEGEFQGCAFCYLSDEDRLFAHIFIQTEGNMKDVERLMGISYPTVKAKLKNLNKKLGDQPSTLTVKMHLFAGKEPGTDPDSRDIPVGLSTDEKSEIINRLASGEIDAPSAARMLRGEKVDNREPGQSEIYDDQN
ncbi:DUF2089 family protein [bacterium]|nr:DUF2089 family protein [bacterium]